MTRNEQVYAICCRMEVGDEIISGRNIKTIQGYTAVNFEDATVLSNIFQKCSFCDSEVGDDSGGMNAICSRPEVADKVVSGTDVDTFRYYACVDLRVAIFRSFRENLNQPFM